MDCLDLILSSRADTDLLGQAIGQALKGGEVLALIGDLGAGKTTLVRGIAVGLGVPARSVSSPTFVLAHEYQGRLPLTHIDLYRLTDGRETDSMGLAELFTDHSVAAIEWADRFPACLPEDLLEIRLAHRSPSTRNVSFRALGPESSALLTRIAELLRKRTSHRPRGKITGQGKASTR